MATNAAEKRPSLTHPKDLSETAQTRLATVPAKRQAGTEVLVVALLTALVAAIAEYGALLPKTLLALVAAFAEY